MLITCPNCLSQFTVEDKLIKTDHQNFKCSVCRHQWRQHIEKKEENLTVSQLLSHPNEEVLFPELSSSPSLRKKNIPLSGSIPEEFKPLPKKKSWTFVSFLVALFLCLCFITTNRQFSWETFVLSFACCIFVNQNNIVKAFDFFQIGFYIYF